jgi:uncharacterized protein YfdQ (DUF2303 family)
VISKEAQTLVQSIRDVLGAALSAVTLSKEATGAAAPIAALPEGITLHSLERYLPAPLRIDGTTEIHSYAEFVDYVNQYQNPGARVFVSPELVFLKGGTAATAYLDFPQPGAPRFAPHQALLKVKPSLEYETLTAIDGKLMNQDTFARTLEMLQPLCTSMAGADLLDMVRTIALTSAGTFKSYEDDYSGSVDFVYDVKVAANAGTQAKKLEVPKLITFEMPLIQGGAVVQITTQFAYRIPAEAGGKVELGLRIPDRKYIERDVLLGITKSLAADTKLPVAIGTSSVPKEAADNVG